MTELRPRLFASDAEIEHLGEGLLACTLRKEEWTHEAHLAATTYLEFFGYILPFIFGSVGFWFAVSGIWRGWGARLCALMSLLIFVHLGLAVFAHNASF